MQNVITFNVSKDFFDNIGTRTTEILSSWLKVENKLDVLVYDFSLGENACFIVDCSFQPQSYNKAKNLTIQLFNRLNIQYEIEEANL